MHVEIVIAALEGSMFNLWQEVAGLGVGILESYLLLQELLEGLTRTSLASHLQLDDGLLDVPEPRRWRFSVTICPQTILDFLPSSLHPCLESDSSVSISWSNDRRVALGNPSSPTRNRSSELFIKRLLELVGVNTAPY